ncbi:DUF305 domain-containing protein [Streptomyces sp. NPDC056600]|uniref:DUF305 domain-containing protein n=1 Tax=Streptomyces sp. NPDC056600 TaxID=3345874 RepID=UPI0036A33E0D
MPDKRSLALRAAALLAAGAAALALTACGGGRSHDSAGHGGHSPATATASPGQPNAADVAFATGMIPHHRQAVEMAGLAPDRAASAEVKRLAAEIEKAQDPEITTLSGWLESWGEDVPAEGAAGGHAAHGGGGMMSAEDMESLREASGPAFDEAFLRMMIEHHEGAVAMAGTERADGSHPPARRMAADIIDAQSSEIARMKDLLGRN